MKDSYIDNITNISVNDYLADLKAVERSDLRHLECTRAAISELERYRKAVENCDGGRLQLLIQIDDVMESYVNQAAFYAHSVISAYHRIDRKVNCREIVQEENITQLNGIRLYINDEYLCIVTPRLSSRNRTHNERSYGETVWRLLACNRNRLPEIKDKAILVYMVYNSDYRGAYKIDPDNVDAKHIVDQVADFYAGDGGNNTIYISAQCTTDEIGTGTYILCLPVEKLNLDRGELYGLVKDITDIKM